MLGRSKGQLDVHHAVHHVPGLFRLFCADLSSFLLIGHGILYGRCRSVHSRECSLSCRSNMSFFLLEERRVGASAEGAALFWTSSKATDSVSVHDESSVFM